MFRCKLSKKNLKDGLDRQERPANCEEGKIPKLNPGIWRRLREFTKKRDIQFYKIQQALIKGILPVARIADKLMTAKSANTEDCQEMKKLGLEAMSLLTHASYEINMQRRLLLKPGIGREYSALCFSQLQLADLLFGDDLQKRLKDIGDQNKIGSKITPAHKGTRPYAGKSGYNSYKQPKNWKRPQSTTLETQRPGEPGQQNPSLKPVEHLPPATCTVSSCSPSHTGEFRAGNIAKHINAWRSLTSDERILNIVMGCQLECYKPPCQTKAPRAISLSANEAQIATAEVKKLLDKGVITKTTHDVDEFISTIFTRPKRDGSHRLILNLKKLNEYIVYHHFKMDSLHSAVQLMKPHCWMAVLDLKDAYYSAPIRTNHRKYLRFEHDGQLYEFVFLPNGLSSAPRIFTKLLKPALPRLREDGVLLVIYIDDIILLLMTPKQRQPHCLKCT